MGQDDRSKLIPTFFLFDKKGRNPQHNWRCHQHWVWEAGREKKLVVVFGEFARKVEGSVR